MVDSKTVPRETPAAPVSRPRRDCVYPVPRATLADREAREYGIEPLDARTLPAFSRLGADSAVAAARGTLRALERTCKACGGGAAYLEKHPELDYCTPECEAHGPAVKKRIASALEIDLSHVPMGGISPNAMCAEDRFADAMGLEPAEDEPVVDVADYVSGLEQDADALAAEVRRVTAERDALRVQLDEALTRCLQLEEEAESAREVP